MKYIRPFNTLTLTDIPLVGGKNASLGQMIQDLSTQGIRIPDGFAVTVAGYWHHLKSNNLEEPIKQELARLTDYSNLELLASVGTTIRHLIAHAPLPSDLAEEISAAYQTLSHKYRSDACDVAVRSSATAEDLPGASFAGQQDTYLNVTGVKAVHEYCTQSMASLFTDRALVYRHEKGFDHFKVGLSIGIQKMIRSDQACSGVMFTLDPESGFPGVVVINASYGLGETIVQGAVVPDEFHVFKPMLAQHKDAVIQKKCGSKKDKLIYTATAQSTSTTLVPTAAADQTQFCLTDDEILQLARMGVTIETFYTGLRKAPSPQDIEWGKDGTDGQLYILQARPETVHDTQHLQQATITYALDTPDTAALTTTALTQGQSIGTGIAAGPARVIMEVDQISRVQTGDIIVTTMTDPDWVPVMKKAAAIITSSGGRTCHAAIVSRELGIPAIVGTTDATTLITDGQEITVDCSQGSTGFVYPGRIPFTKTTTRLNSLPDAPVPLMLNIADPSQAYTLSHLPTTGVGLARMEFIIAHRIGIHPMALLYPERIIDTAVAQQIAQITATYESGTQFFVDTLAYGIATIAAAFYPRPVTVRMSDFKSNEYRNLLGGQFFEPTEENPLIGLRGASRYYRPLYAPAFALECAAVKKVREAMGLMNVKIMLPFVRTLTEAQAVLEQLKNNGLERGMQKLEILMMCEVPSNALLIEDFSHLFDAFSIGSNDLTQLTLSIDRDSALLADLFSEEDPAVLTLIRMAISGAHRQGKPIGICGQGPSDSLSFAHFLVSQGIDSLSLNADAVIPFLQAYHTAYST